MWILPAIAGLLVAALAGFLWRGEQARAAELARERDALREELDGVRREAEAQGLRTRGRSEELQELRRKLERTKKRAFTAQEERAPLEARAAELEAKLHARDGEVARLRGDVERLAGEVERAARDGARLREEQGRLERAATESAAATRIDPEAHRHLTQRVAAAEDEVRRLQAELRESEHETGRWRQRERVQRRAYTVLRGELGVAKDRLRALQGLPGEDPTELSSE